MNARIALLAVLLPLAVFAGYKKIATTVAPITQVTPHVYKLGEPRPIALNVDKPIVVKAATPESAVKH
jgi:hypothetical protein